MRSVPADIAQVPWTDGTESSLCEKIPNCLKTSDMNLKTLKRHTVVQVTKLIVDFTETSVDLQKLCLLSTVWQVYSHIVGRVGNCDLITNGHSGRM